MKTSTTQCSLVLLVKKPNERHLKVRVKRIFNSKEEAFEWIETRACPSFFPGVPLEKKCNEIWRFWDRSLESYYSIESITLPVN